MIYSSKQRRIGTATVFDRACAVLCLLLLCFSVGHTVLGHGDPGSAAGLYDAHAGLNHQVSAPTADTPDTCALCVAMASAAPLIIFSVNVPQVAQPRPPVPVAMDGPVTGWHASLSCRPPPTA
jgi:hypothetical protein